LAHQFGLPVADKKDSQGICFLGKVKINDFLRHYLPDKPGPILNHLGREIGTHKGLHHYTLGQRHGMAIPSNADNEHYVVVGKDFQTNTLHVAFDHSSSEGLYQTELGVHHLLWLHGFPKAQEDLKATPTPVGGWRLELLARPRYRDPKVPSTLEISPTGERILTFSAPQRAIASGQIVAFYRADELLGSGVYL
jgi:tRNA-specific 2-thiouridylase